MAQIEIRPAREDDRAAVLAFCAHTWEWGDYIEYVWEEWLHDQQGALLVATSDGIPVGITHMRMLSAQDVWLEGLRVDPAYRNQGIATALNLALLEEALRRGATVARLLTESINDASIHMAEQGKMKRVGAFAPFAATPVTSVPRHNTGLETPALATNDDLDELVHYLNVSNIFPLVGGLYYEFFTGYSITRELLATKIEAGQVYLLRRWDRLDGLAIAEPLEGRRGKHLFIGYIDGTTESISLLAYALRQKLPAMGLESVHGHVPDLIMVRDAFVGAEYAWDGHIFYAFEKSLS
jgi:GNAT superfamily N-acetyltransferase